VADLVTIAPMDGTIQPGKEAAVVVSADTSVHLLVWSQQLEGNADMSESCCAPRL
jgi:hypothetical protein